MNFPTLIMKATQPITLFLGFITSMSVSGAAETPGPLDHGATSASIPAAVLESAATNSLRLNFRGVPLETVLNYLSEAAGFVIVSEAQPRGKVDVWSEQLVSKEEALHLLDAALLRNGYAAIRKGRTLTIVNRDEAKTHALPVKFGSEPDSIPQTAELVTQIIPVKFTESAQLIPVLQPLVSTHTTITANQSANTLVITDTQENIHRLAKVIQAVDGGAEDFTVVKVFHLHNANSSEMAELLSDLFPDESKSQAGSSAAPFGGGFPGGPGGGGPGFGAGFGGRLAFGQPGGGAAATAGAAGQTQGRLKNRAKVTAVADQRTQSIVVTASRDLMPQVEAVVTQLDQNEKGKQGLAMIDLKNASAKSIAKVLQDAFQKNGTSANRTTSTGNDALENRSTTASQQNNTTTRAGTGRNGAGSGQGGGLGGGGGGAGFGGAGGP